MSLFFEWRDHISRLQNMYNNVRLGYMYSLKVVRENPRTLSVYTRNNEITPLIVKRGYRPIAVYNWSKPITTTQIDLANYPVQPNHSNRSCTFILGGPGAGKSSVIQAIFYSLFGQPSLNPQKFQFGCPCGESVALGKYGPFARCGLDSITDKGSDFVQRFVVDSWFDETITNLFVEGLYVSYPAVYRLIRQCQAQFFRKINLIFLDADGTTFKKHLFARTGGYRYTRKEITLMNEVAIPIKHLKSILATWEGLKVSFRDDDEVIRGDNSGLINERNNDGTLKCARHFRLVDLKDKSELETCEEILSFARYVYCNCLIKGKITYDRQEDSQ